MKVYGYDDTGPFRGELVAAEIRAIDLDFGEKFLASELGWEFCTTRFAEAKKSLIARMKNLGADEEMISAVRECKAGYVPVVN
ncbi:MAG: hypothetical protein ACJA1I_002621 [Zhongshania marina]|jgi:hypothetical protein